MSKNSKTWQRNHRQQTPTKIIVERHYVGTEKMETVFKRIAEEGVGFLDKCDRCILAQWACT
ncbi:MAG: hypothetical protein K2M91_01900 [Lachnospiraceae bacterium]|nr:hypothetical protein [Lachnospiraceae bacterium]